ncbi:AFR143Cp [Eremothecium gossypii ATCC 10895]|uniref:Vacuolar protein sorting-associated protein 17 n=1 Tax=Eremothecium gossypii (strain ATCC 10895 / CBS 109.51 / FGSC 9923 / NRRL Y-1056) TaxID=284811 RepID=Q754C7_EREGS|nr:AFR143Cp [Eremothecium gossypii ATCC 10895]AAS53514.2 AFR143Cp [Eremothecium gossypii ATCC 10895]AEY97826.1 FAFR143Cp [Eremothecium gossypii FDAG1]
MASVMPFDPYDDDVDNNPFAEEAPQAGALVEAEASGEASREAAGEASSEGAADTGDKSVVPPLADLLPERHQDKYHLVAKVTGLERVGTLAHRRECPTVLFDVSTNLPTFRKSQHKGLKKTYEEFQEVFKYLSGAVPETFVPALPPPSTSYGINNPEDTHKTMANFNRWLERVCADPLLVRNEELAFFMESDFNTYTPMNKSRAPASGLLRKTMKQRPPPYDEVTELAEFRPLVKSIYVVAQDVQAKLLRMTKTRKQLSHEESAFGQSFHQLTVEHDGHSRLYQRFGKVLTAVGDLDSIMATFDMATLYDSLEWVVRDAYVVKETLTDRHFLMRDLLQAQSCTRLKQDAARRLRAKRDISPLKVDDAIQQLKLATKTEHDLSRRLQRVTANMRIERSRWVDNLSNSLLAAVREYTLRKIEYERKKLSLLERVRADVRLVDTQGGLSRLGRHQLVASPLPTPSQSLSHGDSWTSDRRASHCLSSSDLEPHLLQGLDSPSPGAFRDSPDISGPLDARQAATILGTSTF